MARCSGLVSTRAKLRPSRRPARLRACLRPFSVSGMSDVPVWRPFRLHSVSPCRASSSSPIAQQANRQNDAPMFERERTDVAEACRRLAAEGLVIGTAGNVSARAGASEVAISPTGATLGALAPEQVTIVDMQGEVVAGDLQPTSELDLHLGVYERYGAGAVVHTHAPMATALSCVLDELPVVHYGMLALGGSVRIAPYATFGTDELAASVLDALDGSTAALMANHGTVTLGADVRGALRPPSC